MPESPHPTYVSSVGDGKVVVQNRRRTLSALLEQMGGRRESVWSWAFEYDDEARLAEVLSALRDIGIPLGGAPHGWPPAEVFAGLRERGLLSGGFREITWSAKGRWHTSAR